MSVVDQALAPDDAIQHLLDTGSVCTDGCPCPELTVAQVVRCAELIRGGHLAAYRRAADGSVGWVANDTGRAAVAAFGARS